MIRTLMASSAVAALLAAGAFSLAHAQTEQPAGEQPAAAQPAPGADGGAAPAEEGEALQTQPAQPTLTPQEPTIATAFMGKSVYSSQDPQSDNIGEVNDLVIGPDGKITHAIVGVGGFLGIGEKSVAVPFDQLQVAQNEGGEIRLIYAATREQLEAAPAYDAAAFDPEARADQQQAEAAGDAGAGAGADAGATAGGVTPGLTPTPADTSAAGADTGAGNTNADNAAAGGNTGAPDPAGTDAAGTNTTVVEQQPVPANETDAPADTVVAPTGDAAAPAADAAAPAQAPAAPPPGAFLNFDPNQTRASSMIGQEIYGPNNESIGEVSDLIVQEDGKTRAALIDVGGFLGIGEKRVSIPFDQITMAPPPPPPADMTAAPAAGTDPAAGEAEPLVRAEPRHLIRLPAAARRVEAARRGATRRRSRDRLPHRLSRHDRCHDPRAARATAGIPGPEPAGRGRRSGRRRPGRRGPERGSFSPDRCAGPHRTGRRGPGSGRN
jgi:sporulation protein YlmC with PRC-barrel domain